MDTRSRHGISTDGITNEPHKPNKAPYYTKHENHQPNKKMCGSAHGVRSGPTVSGRRVLQPISFIFSTLRLVK